MIINKREDTGLKYWNDSKAFIEYLNVWIILKNIIQTKKRNILIVFEDMIEDDILKAIVAELFIRGRKLNIYLVFIKQSYFSVTKNIRLNSRHFFTMKIPNKQELQQIALIILQILTLETF